MERQWFALPIRPLFYLLIWLLKVCWFGKFAAYWLKSLKQRTEITEKLFHSASIDRFIKYVL